MAYLRPSITEGDSISVDPKGLLTLTTQIVSAYITRNAVAAADLPGLIQQVHQVLSTVGMPEGPQKPATALVPAVPVKRSVFPDHIVCLEDGKKLKMLKRHLQSAYGMTPEDYRAKWGLPSSSPMVAPNYAERRSVLAKQIGLGRTAERRRRLPTPRKMGRQGARPDPGFRCCQNASAAGRRRPPDQGRQ